MIRLAADVCAAARAGLCPANMGVFALKQLARLNIYGQTPGVYDLWLQLPDTNEDSSCVGEISRYDTAVAAVSRFSGVLTVSARADLSAGALDELRLFLQQLGGDKLEGEERLLQRLGIAGDAMLPFCGSWVMQTASRLPAMAALPELPPDAEHFSLRPAESLSAVYQLLCKADPWFAAQVQYDAWLVDFSHRCRHQQSECYILTDDTHVVSTISILFLWNGQALAGGVATDPAWQNKGYARRMLAEFCRITDARGMTVQLMAADDRLAGFYERCGWEKQTRWASRGLSPL